MELRKFRLNKYHGLYKVCTEKERNKKMIPKQIHYCWFGKGEKTKLVKKCIASWKRICPDYEITEWNEENFDLDQHPYLRWCYDNRKWAFLSDMARLFIIEKNGGIYFDTDVELLKRPDVLLMFDAFYGFENEEKIATGLGFGAKVEHETIKKMLDVYMKIEKNDDGSYPIIVCPALNTEALIPLGLKLNGKRQNIAGAEILPVDFLNPYNDQTGVLKKTDNTISVHWYSKGWLDRKTILRSKITKPFHRIFGVDCFRKLKR